MADGAFSDDQAKVVDALLLQAVEQRDYDRINLCLQKGADINAVNAGDGRTPLMMAVWAEAPPLVEFLLAKKPALFLQDNAGKNAYDLISDCRDEVKRRKITDLMLRALPDHVRGGAENPAEAARLAEEFAAAAAPAPDTGNVTTGADITVSKPLALPPRHSPKGFSL